MMAGAGALTGNDREAVPGRSVGSPLYVATIAAVPDADGVVVSVATPFVSGTVPSNVPLAKKLTLPEGTPVAELTVAVKVTGWPAVAGLGVATRFTPTAV